MARRMRELTTTFGRGQVDPSVLGLIDAPLYKNAVQTLTNWRLTASGSVKRRPGTDFLADVGAAARLLPFTFSEGQEYIFAFYASNVKIYSTAGSLLTTLSAPWSATEVWEVDYAQQADVMIVVHKDHKPRVITRTGASSFTIGVITWDTQEIAGNATLRSYEPFFQYSSSNQYLAPSLGNGTPTLNIKDSAGTNIAYFQGTLADWNATRFRYQKLQQYVLGTPSSTTAVVGTHEAGGLAKIPFPTADPFQSRNGSTRRYVAWPYHGFVDGDTIEVDGGDAGTISNCSDAQLNTTQTIQVDSRDEFSFTAGTASADNAIGGGPRVWIDWTSVQVPAKCNWWDESAYSAYRGWPAAVTFHENRLIFGGGPSIPDTIFMSRVGQYYNFDTGEALDADAIAITLGTGEIQEIKHIVSNRDLQIFTTAGEFYIPQATDGGPLTPTFARASRQSNYGSSNVEPQILEGATIFAQSNGKALREFAFAADQTDSYQALSLTALSKDVISNPTQMAVSTGSSIGGEQYLYVVNDDGSMACLHQLRQMEMAGWGKWTTDGSYKSVMFMGDNVYLLAQRTVNAVTKYFLEVIHLDETHWLDCGIESSTATLNVFSGFSTFASQTVHVMDADTQEYLGTFAVNGSGEIDVGESGHTTIVAGFNYTPTLKTLPVEVQLQDGFTVGSMKRIVRSVLRVLGAVNMGVDGMAITVANDARATPYTGEVEFYHRGVSRDPTLTITQTEPSALEILSLMLEVRV